MDGGLPAIVECEIDLISVPKVLNMIPCKAERQQPVVVCFLSAFVYFGQHGEAALDLLAGLLALEDLGQSLHCVLSCLIHFGQLSGQ